MPHAVVTLEISPKQRVDLALPLDVPNQVLAPAIAKAMEMPDSGGILYLLSVKSENGIQRLSANVTLGEAGVLDGFVLQIQRRSIASVPTPVSETKPGAFLQTESGDTFSLSANSVSIGRRDAKRGAFVDIDLTPYDSGKMISRRHATIEQKDGKFLLLDLDSVNGTWVNGQRLESRQSCVLQDDDLLVFGRNGVKMKFGMRK